jgi:hypothetical protein
VFNAEQCEGYALPDPKGPAVIEIDHNERVE